MVSTIVLISLILYIGLQNFVMIYFLKLSHMMMALVGILLQH